jgi:fructooligosaccharide transport system substrate-binding protein
MRKFIGLFLIIVLLLTITACGSNENETNSNETNSDNNAEMGNEDNNEGNEEELIELKVWVHVTDETDEGIVYGERIEAFNEAHDNIRAKIDFIPRGGGGSGYEDKINTALTTNQLPDVITLDGPNTAAYADAQIIAPIKSYISQESLEDYLPSIIQQGTYQDEIYALGHMESTVVLFYNVDLLNKYNIEPGTMDNPWNWDELYSAAKTITEGESYPALDMTYNWTGEWKIYAYAPFFWSNGGQVISDNGLEAEGIFNSAENAEALAFLKKLVDDGVTSVTPEESNFQLGLSGLYLNGAWTIPDLESNYPDLNWGVMPYPVSPNTGELHVPTGSWQFAATAQSEHVEEAAMLVEWMTNTDSTVAVSEAIGMPPSRMSAIPLLPQYNDGPRKVLMDQLTTGGHARPVSVIYPVVSRSFEEAVDQVIYGEDPQTVLDEKITVIEREAKRYQ